MRSTLFTIFVLLFLLPYCYSQDAEAEHNELRNLKVVFEKAASNNQLDLLKPYLAKSFSVVTFTDREFKDFESFKKQWQKTRQELLKGGTYTVELQPERSELYGNFAVTKGNSKNIMTTGDGDRFEFTAHWTALCIKDNGKWKILRGHCSLDPFGNAMLVGGVKKIVIKACAVSALIGLILGWICCLLLKRKRHTE